MYNKVILAGNLARDIELRYLPSGSAVANTSIATSRKFKKQDGTQGEEVCFIDLAFFSRTAEIAHQYLHKGSKVLIEGRLKLEQWTDNNGQKRSKHSVIVESMKMLGNKDDNPQQNNANQQQQPQQPETYYNGEKVNQTDETPDIEIDDDEIPF